MGAFFNYFLFSMVGQWVPLFTKWSKLSLSKIIFQLQAEAEKKFIDIAAAKEVLTDEGK